MNIQRNIVLLIVLILLVSCTPVEVEPSYHSDSSIEVSSVRAYPEPSSDNVLDKSSEEAYPITSLSEELQAELSVKSSLSEEERQKLKVEMRTTSDALVELERNAPVFEEEFEVGILEQIDLVRPIMLLRVDNAWQGYIDGARATVYAGKLLPNYKDGYPDIETDHGVLYVVREGADWEYFITEVETGSLRIIDFSDSELILQAAGSEHQAASQLIFSLEKLEFIPVVP